MKKVLVTNRARSRPRRGLWAGVRTHDAATDATRLKPRKEQSVGALLRRISALVAQRQELRTDLAMASELEHNRLEIVRCQRELNHALIELYGRRAA